MVVGFKFLSLGSKIRLYFITYDICWTVKNDVVANSVVVGGNGVHGGVSWRGLVVVGGNGVHGGVSWRGLVVVAMGCGITS